MADPKQILIVDDSEETVLFLSEILEEQGYGYRVANNGRAAMEAMAEAAPDLVLLDIMMPRKSGLGVLKDMKKNPVLASVPVLIVSGASAVTGVDVQSGGERPKESYDDDFARSYGQRLHEIMEGLEPPDGFVEKPIDPPVLVEKVRELLAR